MMIANVNAYRELH